MADLKTLRSLIYGDYLEVTLTPKVLKKLVGNRYYLPETCQGNVTFTFDKTNNTTEIFKQWFKDNEFDWREKKLFMWGRADDDEIEAWCTILEHVKGTSAVQ